MEKWEEKKKKGGRSHLIGREGGKKLTLLGVKGGGWGKFRGGLRRKGKLVAGLFLRKKRGVITPCREAGRGATGENATSTSGKAFFHFDRGTNASAEEKEKETASLVVGEGKERKGKRDDSSLIQFSEKKVNEWKEDGKGKKKRKMVFFGCGGFGVDFFGCGSRV